MPSKTNELVSGSTFPSSVLDLLHSQDGMFQSAPADIWERRFRALTEQIPAMLYTAAPHNISQIEYTSSQFARWLGYPEEEWLNTPHFFESRVHPDDIERVLANDARSIETGRSFTIEYRLMASDGTWRWVHDSASLLRDSEGTPIAWQGVTIDITDLKEAEARQAEARRLYKSLIEQVPAIVFRESVAANPQQLYISPQVESLLGYTPEEWCADPSIWDTILHPDDRKLRTTSNIAGDSPRHVEYRLLAKDGRTSWVREDSALVQDEYGHPLCWQGLLIDITLQKRLEEELVYRARHDSLTGLSNRTYFAEVVAETLERGERTGERLAMLFLDLDGFKEINDSLGHHVGDELLIEVSKRFRESFRPCDLVARFGGDEFAILLAGQIVHDDVIEIAERALTALQQPLTFSDREVRVTGSLGIAFGTAGEDSLSDLLRWADLAMYRAKSSGKNRFAFFGTALV